MVPNGGTMVPAGITRECDMVAALLVQDCMMNPLRLIGLEVMLEISVRSAPEVAYDGITPWPGDTLFQRTSVIRSALFALVASAVSCELPPAQMLTGVAEALTEGREYTLTVVVAVLVQTFAPVEVTV